MLRVSGGQWGGLAMVPGLLKCSFAEGTSPVSTGAAGKKSLQRLLRDPEGMLLSARGGKMVPSGRQKGISVSSLWIPLLATGSRIVGQSLLSHTWQASRVPVAKDRQGSQTASLGGVSWCE